MIMIMKIAYLGNHECDERTYLSLLIRHSRKIDIK
jgi:hypothetical protein